MNSVFEIENVKPVLKLPAKQDDKTVSYCSSWRLWGLTIVGQQIVTYIAGFESNPVITSVMLVLIRDDMGLARPNARQKTGRTMLNRAGY